MTRMITLSLVVLLSTTLLFGQTAQPPEPVIVNHTDVLVNYMPSAFVQAIGAFYVPPESLDAFTVCNLTTSALGVRLEWQTADGRKLARSFFLDPSAGVACERHKPAEADLPTSVRYSWKRVGVVDPVPYATQWW